MAYADKRRVLEFVLGASIADNTDVKSIIIPAGKEVELYALKVYPRTKSPTASAKIELCDASNNILLSTALTGTNGVVNKHSQTTPVTYKNASATDAVIKLRTDQATGTGCDCDIEVHISEPGFI